LAASQPGRSATHVATGPPQRTTAPWSPSPGSIR
jgi:hypothetical protein